MRLLRWFGQLALGVMLVPGLALAEGRTIIVLDGSGSMWGQIDGRAKLEIARQALSEMLADIPAETELGLIAYGHRSKGDCADIETLVAPAPGTAAAIAQAAAGMQFLGKTPLTDAVRLAATDLRSTEQKATVVLITDGIETCQGDPCALAAELEASGVDFTAHVVGFGLTKDEGQQVSCLADQTGGKFLTADNLASLADALKATVIAEVTPEPAPAPEPEPAPAPEPAQLDINFAPVALLAPGVPKPEDPSQVNWELHLINADGSTGDRVTTEYNDFKGYIEPGQYRLVAYLDQATATQDLTLTATDLAAPEVVFNAARLMLHPKGTPDGPVEDSAMLNFAMGSDINSTTYGDSRIYLPAGDLTLTAELGIARQTETIALAPGQLIDRDVVISTGLAAIEAFYVEGMRVEGGKHTVQVLSPTKDIEGKREVLNTNYGEGFQLRLSPGEYVARVELDGATAETPFTIKPGERSEVSVVLNAGVLAISAPGGTVISVYEAKKDINGNQKKVAFDYVDALSVVLPEGDYSIEVERAEGTAKAVAAASVRKGERSEITVP